MTVSIPALLSSGSSVELGKASRPFFPLTTTSPSLGAISVQISEFHVFSVKRESFAQPAQGMTIKSLK